MEKNISENISIKLTVKHNQKLLGKGNISARDTKVISRISAVNYFGNKISSDLDVWLVYEYATLNFNCY